MERSEEVVLSCSEHVVREARRRADIAGRENLAWIDFKGILVRDDSTEASEDDMERVAQEQNAVMRNQMLRMSVCNVGFCTVGQDDDKSLTEDHDNTPSLGGDQCMGPLADRTRRILAMLGQSA